jgi:nucleoredoxin
MATIEAVDFVDALGDHLQRPVKVADDADPEYELIATSAALAVKGTTALYFTAEYCKSCKVFTSKLVEAMDGPFGENTAVVTISYDKSEEEFNSYCGKMPWLSVPFKSSADVRSSLLKYYEIKAIPALVVLDGATGELITADGVKRLEASPDWLPSKTANVQYSTGKGAEHSVADTDSVIVEIAGTAPVNSFRQRFFTTPILSFGHRGINPDNQAALFLDENVCRCRAGLMNIIVVILLVNLHFWGSIPLLVYILYGVVVWELLVSNLIGFTPFAPLGVIASILIWAIHPVPHWKAGGPKRWAWGLGLAVATLFFIAFLTGVTALQYVTLVMFFFCTWMETAMAFCCVCFIHDQITTKLLGWSECKECKMIYVSKI